MNGVDLNAVWRLYMTADEGFIDFAWLVVIEVTETIRAAKERAALGA